MKKVCNVFIPLLLMFCFVSGVTAQTEEKPQSGVGEKKTYSGWTMTSLHDVDNALLKDIQDISGKKASALAVQMKDGFYVDQVDANSFASLVELEADDVITSFNGRSFKSLAVYEKWLEKDAPDTLTLLVYKRSDGYKKAEKLVIMPGAANVPKKNDDQGKVGDKPTPVTADEKARIKRAFPDKKISDSLINDVLPLVAGKDRKVVLDWLLNCDITIDAVDKTLDCSYKSHYASFLVVGIDVKKKKVLGDIFLVTYDDTWIFANSIRVVDDSGFDWTSDTLKFSHSVGATGYCKETVAFAFEDKHGQDIIKSIIYRKGCVCQFIGKGSSTWTINAEFSRGVKVTYDAYLILKKAFEQK